MKYLDLETQEALGFNFIPKKEWEDFIRLHKIPYESDDGENFLMTNKQLKYFEQCETLYLYM